MGGSGITAVTGANASTFLIEVIIERDPSPALRVVWISIASNKDVAFFGRNSTDECNKCGKVFHSEYDVAKK